MKAASDDLKRMNEEQREEIQRLEHERGAALAQCAALKATLESGKRERRELLMKQQELEEIIHDIKANQARAGVLLEEAKGNYDVSSKLVEDRLKDDKEMMERVSSISEELALKKEECDRMKRHTRKLSADMGEMQLKLDNANVRLNALETEKETLNTQLNALSDRSAKVEIQLKASEEVVQTKEQMMKRLEQEHEKIEKSLRSLHDEKLRIVEKQLAAKDDELEREREKSAAAQAQTSSWEEKQVELERQIHELTPQLAARTKELDKIKRSLATIKAENAENKKKVDQAEMEMNKQVESMREKIAEADEAKLDLAMKLKHAEEEREMFHAQNKKLETSGAEQREKIEALTAEIESTRTRLKEEYEALERKHEATNKLHETKVNEKMEKQIELLTKQNKEWINKKDEEHARQLAAKNEKIDLLETSINELREELRRSRETVDEELEVPKPPKQRSKQRSGPKSLGSQREEALPTPHLGSSERRARSRPQPRQDEESPPDERVPIASKRPMTAIPLARKKAKTTKRSKKELKNEVRALAMEADDEDFDPFAFVDSEASL